MIGNFLTKVFGSKNERELKKMSAAVDQINALEDTIRALDDTALRGQTSVLKERFAKGESLEALLPEAFATVREASWRTLGNAAF